MIDFFHNFLLSCVEWLISTYAYVMPWCGVLIGIFTPLMWQAVSAKRWFFAELAGVCIALGCLPLTIPTVANGLMYFDDDLEVQAPDDFFLYWCLFALAGLLLMFVVARWIWPLVVDRTQTLLKPSKRERAKRTDARTIKEQLPPELAAFDPSQHFRASGDVFVGLDENKRPICIPEAVWAESHIFLSGRTRAGKGVAAQSLACQAVMRDEFTVVLDPKGDKWLPSVLYAAAKRAGRPCVFIDLSPSAPPQINPFSDMDSEDAEGALLAAFSLSDKGEAADFYRINDRRAALDCARCVSAKPGITARQVYQAEAERWDDDSKGFAEALREMADLDAINAADGLGLIELARQGGVLYVVGDMENTRLVRAQRLLLIRLQQIAKRRAKHGIDRPFLVFADEFRVHISRPFITSLAASAGWGMRCILACQSFQDLLQVPGDLNPQAVKGSIVENCAISLSYRLKDPDTAEWIAKSTGTILVDDEVREVQANWAMAETMETKRTVRLAERYRIDVNQLLSLPRGCGVLIGTGDEPQFCFTSPVHVEINPEAHQPTLAQSADAATPHLPLAQEAIQL